MAKTRGHSTTALRNEFGISMVELAIALPLLVLLIGGIVDFGTSIRRIEVLSDAAKQGARAAAAAGIAGDDECQDASDAVNAARRASRDYLNGAGWQSGDWDVITRLSIINEGHLPLCAIDVTVTRADDSSPGCIICLAQHLGLPTERASASFILEER